MQLFLAFGVSAGFLLLFMVVYPQDEAGTTRKAFLRGIIASIPVLLGARLLGSLVPEADGSFLLAFHEWADRFLPFAVLPGALYAVFHKYHERIHPGVAARRLTSFYAGALAPAGLAEIVRGGQINDPYTLFLLPILIGAIALAMPVLATRVMASWGAGLLGYVVLGLAATFAASICPWLFQMQLWPLAWLLGAACCVGAWFAAIPPLVMRPPAQLDQ